MNWWKSPEKNRPAIPDAPQRALQSSPGIPAPVSATVTQTWMTPMACTGAAQTGRLPTETFSGPRRQAARRKSGCTMKPRLVTDGAQKQAVPLWHGRIAQEIPGKRTVPTPTAGAVATTTTDPSVWVRCHSRIPPRLLTAGRTRQPALLRSIRPDRISMRA